jgi:ABC-type maltose transport system permease subunit
VYVRFEGHVKSIISTISSYFPYCEGLHYSMPLKRRVIKRKVNSRPKDGNISDVATVYRGPVVPRAFMRADATITVPMVVVTVRSSSGAGGLIFTEVGPAQSAEFTTYGDIYEEFRCLAMSMSWIPYSQNWGTSAAQSLNQTPLVLWPQRNATGTSAVSYAEAFAYAGAVVRSIQSPSTMSVRMEGTLESEWLNTTSSTTVFSVSAFALGLTASSAYGYTFTRYLVQFRSKY